MSSSNNHSKKGTHQHVGTDDCQHLGQTSFDQLELDILQITRLFFLSFHHPESYAWINAYSMAEKRYDKPYGATIANAVLTAINAVCGARGSGLRYHDPKCSICQEYVTPEEQFFIGTLHELRVGNTSVARTMAMHLCEGLDETRTFEAMGQLAQVTTDYYAHKIREPVRLNAGKVITH